MRINGPITIRAYGSIEIEQEPRHPNDYVVVSGFALHGDRGDSGYIDGRDSLVVQDGVTYRPRLVNGTYYLSPDGLNG